jgi:hypothetical protein
MKISKLLVSFFVLALLLQSAVFQASAANVMPQVSSASVYLTVPSPSVAQVGEEIVFDLVFSVTEITPGVAGAEVFIGYDPALVAPLGSPQATTEILNGFFGSPVVSINELLPAAQCPGGTLPCVHLVLAGVPQTTQTGFVARMNFSAVAAGDTCFSILQSGLVDADGFAVPHTVGAAQCVTLEQTGSLAGTVTHQGVPANPNAGGGTLACTTVTLTGAVSPVQALKTAETGDFAFSDLALDTYLVEASYPGYLKVQKSGLVLDGGALDLVLGPVSLRGGDTNGDGVINILDVGVIISKFGSAGVAVGSVSTDCLAADEAADINDDGAINISDLAILAGNWGLVGPVVWP